MMKTHHAVLGVAVSLLVALGVAIAPASQAATVDVTLACSATSFRGVPVPAPVEVGDLIVIHQSGCGYVWVPPERARAVSGISGSAPASTVTIEVVATVDTGWVFINFKTASGSSDETDVVQNRGPAAPNCPDVLFVGARGSGEALGVLDSPGGPEMERLYTQIAKDVAAAGKSVAARQVGPSYTAPGVETITANLGSDKTKWIGRLARNLEEYLRAEKAGVTELDGILKQQAAACPNQRFILAGYSQGAMVVNDYLLATAKSVPQPVWLDRVKAVVLVANPERLKNEGFVEFGTAPRGDGVCGFTDADAKSLGMRRCWNGGPARLTPPFANRVVSVCLVDDIVCSTRQWASDYLFAAANASARKSALSLGTSTHSLYKASKATVTAAKRAAQLALT